MTHRGFEEYDVIIDCDSCVVRGLACEDCVVSVLLGAPPNLELDGEQQRAIDALADAGMVPQLRLMPVQPEKTRADAPGRPARAERSNGMDERRNRQAG
ncbi:MAG: hypothetical protein ACRDQ5_08670 [Sciscionella sp.]